MAERVIIVVARAGDPAVSALEHQAGTSRIALITPRDLARPGWRYVAGSPDQFVAVAEARLVRAGDIAAVVTRFTHVGEADLGHIVAADRAYVAAEVQAFLLGAFTPLSCPMFNRPTATSLAGPYWREGQWMFAAAHSGLAVRPLLRSIHLGNPPTGVDGANVERASVTVIGDECLGAVDSLLRHQARQLARRAGVSLLAVHFARHEHDWYFDNASLTPEVNADIAAAILAHVDGQRARRTWA